MKTIVVLAVLGAVVATLLAFSAQAPSSARAHWPAGQTRGTFSVG